jgi:hypothetical protein
VLGYLTRAIFSVANALDPTAAKRAIQIGLADPLGLDVARAA